MYDDALGRVKGRIFPSARAYLWLVYDCFLGIDDAMFTAPRIAI